MIAAFDPRPVAKLFAAPRALLVVTVCVMWGVGPAWLTVIAQSRGADDSELLRRFVAVSLVALPATFGMLVGAAASEVRRRPVTRLLPRVHSRVDEASRAIGLAIVGLAAALAGSARVEAGVLAMVALAATSYTLGLWALAPSTGSVAWFARIGALVALYASVDRVGAALGATPFAAVALLGAAVALHRARFGAVQRSSPRTASEHSMFVNRPIPVGGDASDVVPGTRGPAAPCVAADATPMQRWRALERFELATTGFARPWVLLTMLAAGVGVAVPSIDALTTGSWPHSFGELARGVRATLTTGPTGMTRTLDALPLAVAAIVAMATLHSRVTFRHGPWRPLPRRVAAVLELRRHGRNVAYATLLLWSLGGALLAATLLLAPDPVVPVFVAPPQFMAYPLLAAALAPWLHAVIVPFGRTRFGAHPMMPIAAIVVAMQMGGILLKELHLLLASWGGAQVTWTGLLSASLVLWTPGFAVLAALVTRDARTADLVRR